MNNTLVVAGSILVGAVVIAGAIVFAFGSMDRNAEDAEVEWEYVEPEPLQVSYDLEGYPSKGDPNAPVTLVEYSDYACPFCKRYAEEVIPEVIRNYVESGQVRIVFKDFVVVGGDRAAEAAHCAGEQGKYWEYHDKLFASQEADRGNWSQSEVHRRYATELELDADALIACFEERRYQDRVLAATREAANNGGRGTPYTLVNETPVSGAQPFSVLDQAIRTELEGAQ